MENDTLFIPTRLDEKAREARFLVDQFDIPPTRAAAVICGSEAETLEVASQVTAHVEIRDPFAGVPVPNPQHDPEHRETHSSELEKPVLHNQADQD